MTEDIEFEKLLRSYAPPIADDGFTTTTIARAQGHIKWRLPILAAASFIGAAAALSQMPMLWTMLSEINMPVASPFVLTSIGVLGFVGWAALDRGWSDAV